MKKSTTTPQHLEEAFEVITKELQDMFVKKHKDYGKGNILANGELGIAMRSSEKVERLKHLLMTQKSPANESIEETWTDLAVYAVIAIMYKRKWFQELELAEKTK